MPSHHAIESEFGGYDTSSAAAILRGMSATVRRAVGGTSGPLYAVFLALGKQGMSDVPAWASTLSEGCLGISQLGGAAEGDRTMLAALIPAAQALAGPASAGLARDALLHRMVQAAESGRDKTAQMMPRRGRSSYTGARAVGHVDPGAAAVAIWLTALQRAITWSRAHIRDGRASSTETPARRTSRP
jgi:triose/dihydroxyacetone kinase / FAD-AMP lyase (cyclizing)